MEQIKEILRHIPGPSGRPLKGFRMIPLSLIANPAIPPSAKVVFLSLSYHSYRSKNPGHITATPTISTIAHETSLSHRTIQRAIKTLTTWGWIAPLHPRQRHRYILKDWR